MNHLQMKKFWSEALISKTQSQMLSYTTPQTTLLLILFGDVWLFLGRKNSKLSNTQLGNSHMINMEFTGWIESPNGQSKNTSGLGCSKGKLFWRYKPDKK